MSWLVSNALIASLLIVVVLVIRRPVAQLFGAGAAYALWLAPAVRLILPPLPPIAPRGKVTIDGKQVKWRDVTPEQKARIRASLDEARRGLAATHIDRAAKRAE